MAILIGIVATAQHYLMMRLMGQPGMSGLAHAAGETLPFWLFWGLAAPAVGEMTRRFPPTRDTWPGRLLLHLAAAAVLSLAFSGIRQGLEWWVITPPEPMPFPALVVSWLASNLTAYFGIAAVFLGLDIAGRVGRRERQAAALRAELTEARLSALRAQLEPHFLFNALNSTAMLVRQGEADRAVRMLSDLGGLLRQATSEAAPQQVRLSQELALVRQYLAIEEIRFADRLRVVVDVPADLGDAEVPSLVLQPLVENAIRHGVGALGAAGVVEIRARRAGGCLHLEVLDDGPGPAASAPEGIGLRNGRARLRHLYGDLAGLALGRRDGRTVAEVTLPLRLVSA